MKESYLLDKFYVFPLKTTLIIHNTNELKKLTN